MDSADDSHRKTKEDNGGPQLRVCIFLVVFVVIIAIIVLATIFGVFRRATDSRALETALPCTRQACRDQLAYLLKFINFSQDPCQNFTSYVCFNWKPQYHITIRAQHDFKFAWMDSNTMFLRQRNFRYAETRKAAAMLDSCLDRPEHPNERIKRFEKLKSFMRDSGIPWPGDPPVDKHPLDVLLAMTLRWNMGLWFEIHLVVLRSGPAYLFQQTPETAYWVNQLHYVDEFHSGVSYSRAFYEFYGVTANDTEIQTLLSNERRVYRTLMNRTVRRSLKTLKLGIPDSEISDQLSREWLQYLAANSPPIYTPKINDTLHIDNYELFLAVNNLLRSLSREDLLRHLGWLFVQRHTTIGDSEASVLRYGTSELAKQFLNIECEYYVELRYGYLIALERLLERENESTGALELAQRTKRKVVETIQQCTWLDNTTKPRVVSKMNRVIIRNALTEGDVQKSISTIYERFPDEADTFTDFWVQTGRAQQQVTSIRHFQVICRYPHPFHAIDLYDYWRNHVFFSALALSSPLYIHGGNQGPNYGGFGVLVARAILQTIDQYVSNRQVRVYALLRNEAGFLSKQCGTTIYVFKARHLQE